MQVSRNSKTRQSAIIRHLQGSGRVLVDELADLLDTTPQTIRKDLNTLADQNQITRFHGGAALVAGTEYTSFSVRQEIARDEKNSIAAAVAANIPNGTTVFVNSGTTTAAAAIRLSHHVGLRVVTDSVFLANEISAFLGSSYGPRRRGAQGRRRNTRPGSGRFYPAVQVDIALIGAAAISPEGALLDYDLREASVARAIIENSRNVILAADSTKFGRAAPVCIGTLSQIDTLVTDKACPDELRALCAREGLDLVLAG